MRNTAGKPRAGNARIMNNDSRTWRRAIAGATLGALAFDAPAHAADIALKAPPYRAVYDWTGFYLGGHVGYGDGSLGPGTNPLPEQGTFFPPTITGGAGGYQAGYNRQLPNRVVLGIEADATFTGPLDQPRLTPAPFNATIDYTGSLRGRIGYAFGMWMPYLTGGFAWGHSHIRINDADGNAVFNPGQYHTGWTVGAGAEFAVGGNWSTKLEYDYIDLSRRMYDLTDFALPGVGVDPRIHLLKFGLNYHFGDFPAAVICSRPGPRRPSSARGCGKAASSISTRNWRRALASTARWDWPDFRMGKRRRPARRSRKFVRSVITSSRPSALAASRRRSPTPPTNCRASATSTASP